MTDGGAAKPPDAVPPSQSPPIPPPGSNGDAHAVAATPAEDSQPTTTEEVPREPSLPAPTEPGSIQETGPQDNGKRKHEGRPFFAAAIHLKVDIQSNNLIKLPKAQVGRILEDQRRQDRAMLTEQKRQCMVKEGAEKRDATFRYGIGIGLLIMFAVKLQGLTLAGSCLVLFTVMFGYDFIIDVYKGILSASKKGRPALEERKDKPPEGGTPPAPTA